MISQKKLGKLAHLLISILIVLPLVTTVPFVGSDDRTITIDGVNSTDLTHLHPLYDELCTVDVYNVQSALLNPDYDTVILRGDFYFAGLDEASGINILSAKTLKGIDEVTADGKPVTKITSTGYTTKSGAGAIVVNAGGVTISNLYILTVDGTFYSGGITVAFVFSDNPITIQNNYIEIEPSPWEGACIETYAHDVPLYIADNHLKMVSNDDFVEAILVAAFWPPYGGEPNQHEVVIRGNTVHNTNQGTILAGARIRIGTSASGTNNALVEYNTWIGTGLGGIEISPYTNNAIIQYNDFSEITTSTSQIRVAGSNNVIVGNVLGKVVPQDVLAMFGWPFFATGIEVININYHPPWTPSWDTENNVIMHNDYRNTDLPGWSFDADGNILTYGSIVIFDYNAILETVPPLYSTSGLACRNNFVFEVGRFPDDTGGPKQQIWIVESELVYDNRVIGYPP
ncbi:MAG: hypothetical protein ACXAD7_10230 [Candidatus Kariarchaeaceae archaeon]|jgi:hypothetical protein